MIEEKKSEFAIYLVSALLGLSAHTHIAITPGLSYLQEVGHKV